MTEEEFKKACVKLAEQQERLGEHRKRLEDSGITGEKLTKAMQPLETFVLQLQEEIESHKESKV